MAPKGGGDSLKVNSSVYKDKSKPTDIRLSNINAAKAVADAIRTSLGPRGMDKMIQAANGEVTITNDGATILKQMSVIHPAAKMLVELSRAQDIEAGDGTTSVVVLAGALLQAAEKLLQKGIHPMVVSDGFQRALAVALTAVERMATPVDLDREEELLQAAATSLNSKVVSQHASVLAPIAVHAIQYVMERYTDGRVGARVDLRDVRVVERVGGTAEDSELWPGGLFLPRAANVTGPRRVEKAKVALIQFCISPPKTDMDHSVVVGDYAAMDRVLKEERQYILNIVKAIKKAGVTVLLVQKSILRDALSELAVHFLDKIRCLVVKDIEREDVEFVSRTLGCRPIASLDHLTAEALAQVDLVEEIIDPNGKYVKMTGCYGARTATIVVRGGGGPGVAEAARSLHDALCCVRCVARRPALLPGGGAPEAAAAAALRRAAITARAAGQYCLRAYADALEVVPSTLAENAGLNPIETVTELRAAHADTQDTDGGGAGGGHAAGVNVRRGRVTDMRREHVMQPLHVTTCAFALATETVRSILKIDDIINTMN